MMAGSAWDRREVLELDAATAVVFVEKPERSPALGGRWLVFQDAGEVWHELPAGRFQRSVYKPDAFPGEGFVLAE